MNTCLYLDSRWIFTLTITASVSWEIRQNLTIFFVSLPLKVTCEEGFLLKSQAFCYHQQFYQRWTSFAGFFLVFGKKSLSMAFSYSYLFLLLIWLSVKMVILLKLPHLITFLPRLDQSNETHFTASWWAIIKERYDPLFSNGIYLNFTLISTTCCCIVSR